MPDIRINGSDGEFGAYLARPEAESASGVLVIQEIFGVNKDMRAHCDLLASRGFLALCPDIFWRQEPGVQLTDGTDAEWQRAFELFQGFDVDNGIVDLKSSLQSLREMDECTGRVGTVGFCLGGKLVYMMACRSDADCNVAYYGVGIEEMLGESAHITTPTLLHIAEEDEFVGKEAQARINESLSSHSCVTLYNYPNVNHAFARHDGNHYDAGATALADERTMACFQNHLIGTTI
ncbi:MAG: dienelactone hydrolase family protein [Gammaproteobacteria bacterium]